MSFLKDRLFYGWVIAAAAFVISFIGIGARFSYGVFLKSMEVDFEMSRGAISGVFSVYMLLCCLMAIIGGWAQDRYGPRKLGLVMATFTGLAFVVTSQVQSPWHLLITYSLMLSLGTGTIYTLTTSTASRWFERRRGFVVGLTTSAGGVGTIAIAPFATYLIAQFDWRTAFVVIGLIAWVGMAASALLMIKDPHDIGLKPDGVKPGSRSQQDVAPDQRVGDRTALNFSLAQAMRLKRFWVMAIKWFAISLTLHMVFVHVIPYAVDMGIDAMDAALILSLMGFANIVGRLIVGKISDAVGTGALGLICILGQFAALLWLLTCSSRWMFYTFGLTYGFLWGGAGTIIAVLVSEIFGTRRLGSIMGFMSASWAIGAAIGPAIGGFVFDFTGSYAWALGLGAASLTVAACLQVAITRYSK